MKKIEYCPCCGRKIVEYKHKLNKVLIKGLRSLKDAGGCERIDNLNLSSSEFNNFQKLGYFGLAVRSGINSKWQITTKGVKFLGGVGRCEDYVITLNGRVIAKSGNEVLISDVKDSVMYRIEWQEQATQSLFDNV